MNNTTEASTKADIITAALEITDTQAASVLALYEKTIPTDDWVSFTTNDGAAGADASLAVYLREVGGSGLRWRFAEAPSVTSVKPGLSTVQVRMTGQLDG